MEQKIIADDWPVCECCNRKITKKIMREKEKQNEVPRMRCSFGTCKRYAKTNEEYCGLHLYRNQMVQCTHIMKNGERCKQLCTPKDDIVLCVNHNLKLPNKCKFVGKRAGLCDKPCRGEYCGTHNPAGVEKRRITSRECMKRNREEQYRQEEIQLKELCKQNVVQN